MQLSIFLSGEPPVSHSVSRDSEVDWLTSVATWPSSIAEFLSQSVLAGSSGKTCPESLHLSQMKRQVQVGGGGAIWESSDFATLLSAFRECGYSCAWRMFDANHFGVPQRRRRLFVVGYYGTDWRPPAAVLFDPQGGGGNIATGNGKGKKAAGAIIDEATRRCWWDGGDVSQTLDAVLYKGQMMPEKNRFPVVLDGHIVRKLTPLECERLQGFPDNYTAIPGAKDGPRLKAIGNSFAIPVVHYIGRRIDTVNKLLHV